MYLSRMQVWCVTRGCGCVCWFLLLVLMVDPLLHVEFKLNYICLKAVSKASTSCASVDLFGMFLPVLFAPRRSSSMLAEVIRDLCAKGVLRSFTMDYRITHHPQT